MDRVRSELLTSRKTEDLVRWVGSEVPEGFFFPVDTADVANADTNITMWVQRQARYFDHAKAKGATDADGWLVAYAWIRGAIIVTNEQSAPESKEGVKLFDLCAHFWVQRHNMVAMHRALNVQFDWAADTGMENWELRG